ncbi:MAG: hypothetical protein FWF79_05810 [Defluviitaleaceae bacterium]|nr:hypothetical protein [Defluviitaleaceae bacterium]
MIRLTNAMMTNTTLMNINRNIRSLDEVVRQIETKRLIQRPSDNPIIASRALLFRTSLSENVQFLRNVDQGVTWMNVTESTFDSINSRLLFELNRLTVQGATDSYNLEQKQGIVQYMQAFFNQIGDEINRDTGGSFLFSGFRTDEPPMFRENNQRSFVITQHFNLSDISRIPSFQRLPGNDGVIRSVTETVSVLNLAYTGLDALPHMPGFEVRQVSINDPHAYQPPEPVFVIPPTIPQSFAAPPVVHFVAETGELVLHDQTANHFPREGVSVTYQKTGFLRDQINPIVYFTGREIITDTMDTSHIPGGAQLVYNVTMYLSRAAGAPFPAGATSPTHFDFTLPHTPYTGAANLMPQSNPNWPPGAVLMPDGVTVRIPTSLFNTASNLSVTFALSSADYPTLPFVGATHIMEDIRFQGVELVRAHTAGGVPIPLDRVELNRSFDMSNQGIEYEFSLRARIQVNSLAKNVLTDKMFSDFRRFFEFANSLVISERSVLEEHYISLGKSPEVVESMVSERLITEEATARDALHEMFNSMLLLIRRHMDNITREHTNLGARMVRMEIVQDRLEADYVSYTQLTRDNEGTDIAYALVRRESALALFHASLRANSGIMQMSLANFLR